MKHYKPEPEEFYKGFKFRVRVNAVNDWRHFSIRDGFHLDFILNELKDGMVDVKIFDRDDLKQLGWTEYGDFQFPHKAYFNKPCNVEILEDGVWWGGLLSLTIRECVFGDFPWIKITKYAVHDKDTPINNETQKEVIFEGRIRNISEFEKLVTEQLQIK